MKCKGEKVWDRGWEKKIIGESHVRKSRNPTTGSVYSLALIMHLSMSSQRGKGGGEKQLIDKSIRVIGNLNLPSYFHKECIYFVLLFLPDVTNNSKKQRTLVAAPTSSSRKLSLFVTVRMIVPRTAKH